MHERFRLQKSEISREIDFAGRDASKFCLLLLFSSEGLGLRGKRWRPAGPIAWSALRNKGRRFFA
ncbi:hypothetical protein B1812_02865 [Methylocystis bryophila]|uniref:Uncharacterized protein n=1 Tax=Methylocystis bryophila TaxID=655015 RepID=A0A1W6MRH0_9HYPH|nr:hypothetical protein B1812_02865 [Methylocystis bryophila]